MAVLVGVLLGLSRSPPTAKSPPCAPAGIGVWTFVRIVSIVAVLRWALSLLNTLYLAPKATEALLQLEDALKTSQASFEIQPRVFYEDFKNYVLYVQASAPATARHWRRVFLADLTDPASPQVTTAAQATVVNGSDRSHCACAFATARSTSSSPTIPTSTPSPPSPNSDLPLVDRQRGRTAHQPQ